MNRLTFAWLCLALALCPSATAKLDISGTYRFRLCDPVPDERLLPLAVNTYETVQIKTTTNALDICKEAFELNWKIENHMEAKICVLDDTKMEPLVRIDKVLSTKQLPRDPHNLALEMGLKEDLRMIEKMSFQGDLLVLETVNGHGVCVALEKINDDGKNEDQEDEN